MIPARHAGKAFKSVIPVSILVLGLVAFMAYATPPNFQLPFDIKVLPKFHAMLNAGVSMMLIGSFIAIKRRNIMAHMMMNMMALMMSAAFLISYVVYHTFSESTVFGDIDHNGLLSETEREAVGGLRLIYVIILLSHIGLAAIIFPIILYTFMSAFTAQFGMHKKLVKWTMPLWLYVSITGVIIYFMISPYYG